MQSQLFQYYCILGHVLWVTATFLLGKMHAVLILGIRSTTQDKTVADGCRDECIIFVVFVGMTFTLSLKDRESQYF